ncbi:thioesterase II family protein [Streptomyces sp. WELS2]|uniref:thioesterase II family protein n=1 Tax=Streptomyces sp. WELS2 TaxID=2749435 RepID=UPI0015F0BA4C|nr:thioesterase [Streptomyces sp. WELS2]
MTSARPAEGPAPKSRPARPAKWLLRRPKSDAGARIFLFPYAGVGASMYTLWPERIGGAEVCLVQLPGRETRLREPHFGTYEELAGPLVEALVPYLDRPFAFFGHCSGVLPAVEAVRELARRGLPVPGRLFVSSQVAPHDGPYGRLLDLGEDELAGELAALIRATGGEPHPDLIELGVGVLAADIEANRRYRVAEPFALPTALTTIGWRGDEVIPPALMGGWSEYPFGSDVREVLLEGTHYDFLKAPAPLLEELAHDLAELATGTETTA